MHVLIVSATGFEAAALQREWPAGEYPMGLRVEYLATGVGPLATGVALTERCCAGARPDLLVNVGVAGALDRALALGQVVNVASDYLGDLGARDADGSFLDVTRLGLADPDAPPYRAGRLYATGLSADTPGDIGGVPAVRGVTVSTAHGDAAGIARFRARTDAQVETMEGAAFFLVALRQNLPCVQLRGISNYVEPRDRGKWRLADAIEGVSAAASALLSALPGALAARSARRQLGR